MLKIDVIDSCGDCSHRYYEGNDMYCDITDEMIDEDLPIPNHCQLEDCTPEDEIKYN